MASVHLGAALRQIHGLFEAGTVAGLTDGQLLDRYLARRDESAFAALVTRHGPMVLGVCHSVLRGAPEVEDAFQATFLVLIRKAEAIRGREAVGGWLHRVAHRVAIEAIRDRSRKDRRECRAGHLLDLIAAEENPTDDDWRIPLHEELARLPERLRQPVVLCYLQGKTHAQAAMEMSWSEATLRRRLADARGLLHARLTRRGVAISSVTLAGAMASQATAAVPPAWVNALARTAVDPSAGHVASAAATRLARSVVRSLLAGQVRAVANVMTVLLATSLVAGHLVPVGPAKADDPARSMPRAARPSTLEPKDEAEETVAIRGRVLDPDGEPFAGAKIYAYRHDRRRREGLFAPGLPAPDATSDADGRFEFATPDPGLRTLQVQAHWAHPTVAALAPGFGPGWSAFTTADQARDLTLKLAKDDVPIVGRIVDFEGHPVPGATVRPVGVYAPPSDDLTDWEAAMAEARFLSDDAMKKLPRLFDLLPWGKERAVTTDADGRFRLTGIGRERVVSLWIEGPTIASTFATIHARTRPGSTYSLATERDRPELGALAFYGATFEYPAPPPRPIEGTVRDKDTGRAIAGISIRSESFAGSAVGNRDHVRTTTGPDGRYRLVGMPPGSGNWITAHPGPEQPYLGAGSGVPGEAGLGPARVDFELKRGVAIRGKVTDKATGKPVAAGVEYLALPDNPHRDDARGLGGETWTRPDGSFEVVGLPGRGLVVARAGRDRYLTGPRADKISEVDPLGTIKAIPHGFEPDFLHAIVAVDPSEDARSFRCDVVLDPGVKRLGHVVGPDGRPVSGCTAANLYPATMSPNIVELASDAFTAMALDPRQPRPLFFRHDGKQLAAVVMVRGDETGPLTVCLQPAGAVTGRLVADDGQPRHDVRLNVNYAEGQFGPRYYLSLSRPTLGHDGRFRIESLIPGVTYNLGAIAGGPRYLGDFATGIKLQPGETRDLGDVKVKPPR
jgi:RNA polymerase sigma factor (sigma-70 family)